MDKYILAHDLGTSSNKACLFNERGQVVAEETVNYTTYYGKNGEAEQAHEDWWNAVVIGTRRVLERAGVSGAAVAAVGLSAQMNSLVPVDRSGKPITERCMTWMDMRGKEQAAFVLEKFGQRNYYRLCGSSVELTIMQFTKLMWMKDHRPEEYARIYKVLGVKEYIVQRLTGHFGENDFSDAYAAGMMNINTSKYEKDFLALIGIPRKILCDPVPSTTVIGAVTPQAATATGLSEETKVVLGCGDGISCYIGAGGLMKDTMIATFGTASWISMTAERAIMEDGYQAGVTPLDDGRYYINMHSHATGAVTDWSIRNILGLDGPNAYVQAETLAAASVPGAHGLYLNPSFIGGNGCYPDIMMEGAFVGLKLSSTREDLARAIYESAVLDLAVCNRFFQRYALLPKQIRMIGGGGRSKLQRQILADVFGVPVAVLPSDTIRNAGAIGAFMHAGVGIGLFRSFEEAYALFDTVDTVEPQPSNTAVYREIVARYMEISDMLASMYQK